MMSFKQLSCGLLDPSLPPCSQPCDAHWAKYSLVIYSSLVLCVCVQLQSKRVMIHPLDLGSFFFVLIAEYSVRTNNEGDGHERKNER